MITAYFERFIRLRDELNVFLKSNNLKELKPREAETIDWISRLVLMTTVRPSSSQVPNNSSEMYLVIKQLFALFILSVDDIADEYPVDRAELMIAILSCKIKDLDQFNDFVRDDAEVYQYETIAGLHKSEINYLRYIFDLIRMIVYIYEEYLPTIDYLDDPNCLNKIASILGLCCTEYAWSVDSRISGCMISSSQRLTYHHTQGAGFALHIDGLALGTRLDIELPDYINKTFLILNSIAGLEQELIRGDKTNYVFCFYRDIVQLDVGNFGDLGRREEIIAKIRSSPGVKMRLKAKLGFLIDQTKEIFMKNDLDFGEFERALWRIYPVQSFFDV